MPANYCRKSHNTTYCLRYYRFCTLAQRHYMPCNPRKSSFLRHVDRYRVHNNLAVHNSASATSISFHQNDWVSSCVIRPYNLETTFYRFQSSHPDIIFSGGTVCNVTTDRSLAARTAFSVFPEGMSRIT